MMRTMRLTHPILVALGLTLLASGLLALPAAAAEPQAGDGAATPTLFDRYCVGCHNERLKTGGLVLDGIDLDRADRHAAVLEEVVRKLRSDQMPPAGRPRPAPAERDAFVRRLETALDQAAAATPNPGRVVVRRLNRLEYVNAIRELLALEVDGDALLPADDSAFGFDNNAEMLSLNPSLMARYVSAATKVSRLAMNSAAIRPVTEVFRASPFARQNERMGDDFPFGTHGGLAFRHTFPLDGEYAFRIRMQRNLFARTIRGTDDEHEIEVRLNHELLRRFSVGGQYPGVDIGLTVGIAEDDIEGQQRHAYRMSADDHMAFRRVVEAGTQLVTVAFTDTAPSVWQNVPLMPKSIKSEMSTDDAGDPGIDRVEISGPYDGTVPDETPSRSKVLVCRPDVASDERSCARQILETLARRAYRRPVTDADIDPLLDFHAEGRAQGTFDDGIERAIEALLVSPHFLLRVEQDPAGAAPGTIYRLSDLELASRLSFFLWSSLPDDELLAAAEAGRLREPAVLERQVRRMLADRRASTFATNFANQWLITRNASVVEPNPRQYPNFDDSLRRAMMREVDLFIDSQVREDRSILELLTADYTFLNERLAGHYGIADVYGGHFRRVQLADDRRHGLLGKASVLTVTSYAHRTSVVTRGKWVLENVLGVPPPDPPPNVPALEENDGRSAPTSLRERMEQHRSNPVCASCHQMIDPLGFALENYDATGGWRDLDDGLPVDASSEMADGRRIDGPRQFREFLVTERGDAFVQTVTEKLLTYALGRGLEYYDMPTVRELMRQAERDDYRWSSLVLGIVRSDAFQMRRVAAADTARQARRTP